MTTIRFLVVQVVLKLLFSDLLNETGLFYSIIFHKNGYYFFSHHHQPNNFTCQICSKFIVLTFKIKFKPLYACEKIARATCIEIPRNLLLYFVVLHTFLSHGKRQSSEMSTIYQAMYLVRFNVIFFKYIYNFSSKLNLMSIKNMENNLKKIKTS